MTENILRKASTGEPTTNPGQFGTHTHSNPEASLPGGEEEHDWFAPGEKVFVVSRHRVNVQTVARTTATLIILDDGARFPKKSMSIRRGSWDSDRLRPINDQFAIQQLREERSKSVASQVSVAADAFRMSPSQDTAAEVERLLGVWRETAAGK